jgi:alpha-beta hydrolase superfamily lysophospholipase
MRSAESRFDASDVTQVFLNVWLPDAAPKAALVIAHGLAEHSARYLRFARSLTDSGFAVYAPDHRGHGRTASTDTLGRFPSKDGFRRVRDDLVELSGSVKSAHPGIPMFLMGHSMGTLLALTSLSPLGSKISGCVLSGVLAPPSSVLAAVGSALATLGGLFKGVHTISPLLDKLTMGSSNDPFRPARTPFDWLSREAAEVDAYIADPLCGFACSFGLYRQLLEGFSLAYGGKDPFSDVPRTLPIYIFAGSEDPVGGARGFVGELEGRFRSLGFIDLESRVYPGARHETLNEINRDAVVSDLRAWLETRVL